mgnify:FL=1
MKRSGPIKRYTPVRKKRLKPRRGQPTAQEKAAIRQQVYNECGGRCELNLGDGCMKGVLPFDGDVFHRWHLVHKKSKRRFGWARENLCGGCPWCHLVAVHTKGMKIDE